MSVEMTSRCAIYCRVSDPKQLANMSLETQREACERYARSQGWAVAEVFVEEGESAKTATRTEFDRLLKYCRSQRGRIQYVVVYAVNRYMRNTQEHLAVRGILAGIGIQLRSATEPLDESPGGKLLETMLAGVAQFHNDEKSLRTKAGMKHAMERGKWTHVAPLGYRNARDEDGRALLLHDERAPLVRQAFEMVAAGASQRETASRLKALGLRGRKGAPVATQTIERLLRNPVYMGRLRSKAFDVDARGDFEPIVTEKLFLAVQAQLGGGHPADAHARQRPEFPLKHFVRCECGRPLTAYFAKGKARLVPYYECPGCRARVGRDKLEDDFIAFLDTLRPDPRIIQAWQDEVLEKFKAMQREAEAAADRLRRRSAELAEKRDRLVEACFVERAIPRESFDALAARYDADRGEIELQLAQAHTTRANAVELISRAIQIMTHAGEMWRDCNLEQRLALQGFIFPEGLRWSKANGLLRTQVSHFQFSDLAPESAEISGWRTTGAGVRTRGAWDRLARLDALLRAAA